MMKGSDKWHVVEEKLAELRRLVEGNWDKEEWQLAVLGESTIRTVEQSKAAATAIRQQTNEILSQYGRTMNIMRVEAHPMTNEYHRSPATRGV